ncbi:GL23778 [Drosophila persimilis]|uniref:ribonuclease III n=1 Tax=Drosophila persimilis TaxID=7234 RepID=B4G5V8_DROPE|nr:endoribonuclease Dcr-1 [Drosophila persimilis]EDW23737.1 GL23778 [Drosophila persimilis]
MAFHWCDNNLHTTVFTPRDFQVELLAAAYERNTIICLGHRSSKEFIALKLLQELSRRGRRHGKVSVYLSCQVGIDKEPASIYTMLTHLTDLRVWQEQPDMQTPFAHNWMDYHVSILRPEGFLCLLVSGELPLTSVELIVLEDCHDSAVYQRILPIFLDHILPARPADRPRILGLAGPLHSAGCELQQLSAMLVTLEQNVLCRIETASDIVTVLRYCSKPHEYIVQCAPFEMDELSLVLADILNTHKSFLMDHRYDPFEIYGMDQFMEDLKDIPDPKLDPLNVIDSLLVVLHEMGPWCTQRAAHHFYQSNEKLKVKTPHERHYLLYCLVSTALVQLHSLCDHTFQKQLGGDPRQTIERYSSPKVKRLLQTLRCFKPEEGHGHGHGHGHGQAEVLRKMRHQVEQADFNKLSHALETKCQVVDQLEPQATDARTLVANLEHMLQHPEGKPMPRRNSHRPLPSAATTAQVQSSPAKGKHSSNPHNRVRRRVYTRRHNRDQHDGGDTLCALIYCNQNHTARVLFELLAEMGKRDADLKFLRCQYTTDRVADPTTEPKEAELEHRRQEEVLKRFRMHDCNVLIGTSVLEEGIDVPKCNLVVRWDPPTTYRSYVQCKGRARAAPAYHVILVAPRYTSPAIGVVQLTDKSHRFICGAGGGAADSTEVDSDSDDSAMPNSLGSDPYTFGTARGTVKILNPEVFSSVPPMACEIKEIQDETPAIAMDSSNSSDEAVSLNNTPPSESQSSGDPKIPRKRFQCEVPPAEGAEAKPEANTSAVDGLASTTKALVHQMAQYREIEQMLLSKCANTEPPEQEQQEAERFNSCLAAYRPKPQLLTGASVDLSTAIALVNKYCARLPSDTFTKLTALWRCAQSERSGVTLYQYTLRLPINSPLKHDIVGLPMTTQTLARRLAALQACVELHKIGELDDQLQPIGKEGFRALEPDWECFELEPEDEQIVQLSDEPRPGTTKRRQYYYKRIASEFCDCRPVAGAPCYLYFIKLTLQCPIPEEQNTRGRKIYPPEDAQQGFGILTMKRIPKLSAFSIFTRSGEVKVSLELAKERVVLTPEQIGCINVFLNYTFTNVLRLQKFLMLFDPDSTENCVFIVPTLKTGSPPEGSKKIDWQFLELIQANGNTMPKSVPDEERLAQPFDAQRFQDAVVMPWYRNQDQPQYFYVAEICPHLSPLSCFPGDNYRTFKHYYFVKYGLTIQNAAQPLLDVDHTSARLNFLTPRYVNRKGVALPTSSEETKRAKRENLEQKQILVPELCTVHPFPASLWRTAVCLPCILYRINGLLLADDIRKQVSADLGLGRQQIDDEEFEWPMLDFGWSLSEVLKKSRESKQKDAVVNGKEQAKEKESEPPPVESEPPLVEKLAAKSANELIIEGEQKLQDEDDDFIEIGTWSNDMADDIASFNDDEDDEDEDEESTYLPVLPANVKFCDQHTRYGSPTFWDVSNADGSLKQPKNKGNQQQSSAGKGKGAGKPSFTFYDSDNSLGSSYGDDDHGMPLSYFHGNYSSDEDAVADDIDAGRIEFTSKNEAETIETAQDVEKRQKQISIIQATNANERQYQQTKNLLIGFKFEEQQQQQEQQQASAKPSVDYEQSILKLQSEIESSGMLVPHDQQLALKRADPAEAHVTPYSMIELLKLLLPYVPEDKLLHKLGERAELQLSDLIDLNADWVSGHSEEEIYSVLGCGDSFDNYNDQHRMDLGEKQLRLQYASRKISAASPVKDALPMILPAGFSFDLQPELVGHPGPSPSVILQALTMSNANDGINLERLETIGDSFLKYAITTYLYITYENVHEGKLSHLRSKQVANLNLYRLGRRKRLGEYMIATKFEPHDNWLPPCYYVPKELEKALIEAKIPTHHWKLADLLDIKNLSSVQICEMVREKAEALGLPGSAEQATPQATTVPLDESNDSCNDFSCFIPYNLVSQHSIPDKSIADCVEALIGAYLIECGPRGALLFMAWLGVRVLPYSRQPAPASDSERTPGSTTPDAKQMVTVYGSWPTPRSPLLHYAPNAERELEHLLSGFEEFEASLGYRFRDRSYLLQAMTHASYTPNRLTDCYQRLEFLGDAVLDYLITRHLYEDPRQHSPGALTDLRSALVNNTIFASLAVRHGFHKFFRHLSPGLNDVIDRFVRIQQENGHSISEEYYLLSEEECDDAEDVEVPKALGDVFESIAGAIFLDSNMSLDVVWHVYSNMMSPEIEQFSNSVPKSPIRELLELEPETAKFGKPEKLADGRRVRVTVDVFCKGTFRGIGRNYRIAKCTAAKCALRQLKKQGLIAKKD